MCVYLSVCLRGVHQIYKTRVSKTRGECENLVESVPKVFPNFCLQLPRRQAGLQPLSLGEGGGLFYLPKATKGGLTKWTAPSRSAWPRVL